MHADRDTDIMNADRNIDTTYIPLEPGALIRARALIIGLLLNKLVFVRFTAPRGPKSDRRYFGHLR